MHAALNLVSLLVKIHHMFTFDSGAVLHYQLINRSLSSESVSLRDIGKPTSRAEISSSNSICLKAVKGAHPGSALTGATSELKNSNRKKSSIKTHYSLLRK